MRSVFAILAAGLLTLAGCSDGLDKSGGDPPPSPLLYELASSDGGELEGWLFGTIHALPEGTVWRTDTLDDAVSEADLLVVEIANLDDQTAMFAAFRQLSFTPDLPDIGTRVAEAQRPALFDLVRRANYAPHDFQSVETWAAALMLAQVSATGDPELGADRALIREFGDRQVIELEGAEAQLAIFDTLPETDQRDLLASVIAESQERDPARLRKAWLAGDEDILSEATTTGMMADPELRRALLVGRNRNWARQITPMLARNAKPLVAVGTAHLVGEESLVTLLERQGYTARRIQ